MTDSEIAKIMVDLKHRELQGDSTIHHSTQKYTIKIGVHSLIVRFTPSKASILHVEIHAAEPNRNNLKNINMAELIKKYDGISDYVNQVYGISYLIDRKSEATITTLELNRTFTTPYPYASFYRVVSLLGAVIEGTKLDVSNMDHTHHCFVSETTVFDRKTYTVRIYEKSRELEQKKGIYCPVDLPRVELIYKKPQTIMTDMQTIIMTQVTQAMLENAYISRFKAWQKDIDKYLYEKCQYHPHLLGSHNTAANLCATHCQNGSIKNHAAILADIIAHENLYKIPILLDGNDLIFCIKNLQAEKILTTTDALEILKTFKPVCNESVNAKRLLSEQRTIYNDFFEKITGTNIEKVNVTM